VRRVGSTAHPRQRLHEPWFRSRPAAAGSVRAISLRQKRESAPTHVGGKPVHVPMRIKPLNVNASMNLARTIPPST